MKKIATCFILVVLLVPFLSNAQLNYMASNTTTHSYEHLGAVKGSAGVIGDNYYVIENDFGSRFDLKNNIRSSLARFSISTGKFLNRIYLNELVATDRKEVDKILFCEIFTWKDKIIAFYTYKKTFGKEFDVSTAIFSPEGQLLKGGSGTADFDHESLQSQFGLQQGLLISGRNTLSVIYDLKYRMTPDSSLIAILCSAPDDNSGNVRIKTYDPNLNIQKDLVLNIPLPNKKGDLLDFQMDSRGYLYLLTRTPKTKEEKKKNDEEDDNDFALHIVNTRNNNSIQTRPISIYGNAIRGASIVLKKDGHTYCVGSYTTADNKKLRSKTTGLFSIWIDPEDPKAGVTSFRDVDDFLCDFVGYNKKSWGPSLNEKLNYYDAFQDGDNGLFVILVSEVIEVIARGTTGAMNSYNEVTKFFVVVHIGAEKKIKWLSGKMEYSRNQQFSTRLNRAMFLLNNHQLCFTYFAIRDSAGLRNFYYTPYKKENGYYGIESARIIGKMPLSIDKFGTVERTLYQLNENEYILTIAGPELAFYKFRMN